MCRMPGLLLLLYQGLVPPHHGISIIYILSSSEVMTTIVYGTWAKLPGLCFLRLQVPVHAELTVSIARETLFGSGFL